MFGLQVVMRMMVLVLTGDGKWYSFRLERLLLG
jgi:hypothetical protein